MSKTNEYDAVIIGAGISGLVCGCYLAKVGMKVLIVEKSPQPGGYCTSFTRQGFFFDACAHSLGSMKNGEIVSVILKDLDILERIQFQTFSPSDMVITPDIKVNFYNDINKTIDAFSKIFKHEAANIKKFFEYINDQNGFIHVELRTQTFKELLDNYFADDRLKSILSVFTLGNVGLPPSSLSAFTAVKFYRQFMLDGGYYPVGGMQGFADILAQRFQELGGVFMASKVVTKVQVDNGMASGVILKSGESFISKYVVSACDAKQTFTKFLDQNNLDQSFINKINNLVPSISAFVLYVGLTEKPKDFPASGLNIWYMPEYDLEKIYKTLKNGNLNIKDIWFLARFIPDTKSFMLITNVPFKTEVFWKENKNVFIESFINQIEKVIPSFSSYIKFKDAATPQTLYKWTGNYCGASYGWAALPEQFAVKGLSQATPLKNLYLTGHWTTVVQGLPGVTYIGRDTANIIIKRFSKR